MSHSHSMYATLLFVGGTSILATSQTEVGGLATGSETVRYYRVPSLAWTELRPGIRIKPIVGETSTFALVELGPQAKTSPHHHTHEQANFGLEGVSEIVIDGIARSLSPAAGTLAPADAEHFVANNSAVATFVLEFQPVRRLDLLPPRPPLIFPANPTAVHVSSNRQVSMNFDVRAGNWKQTAGGARVKSLVGETCALAMWDVPVSAAPVDLKQGSTGNEQFVYLVEGHAEVNAASNVQRIEPGTLLLIARDAPHVRLRAVGSDRVAIVEFHAAARGK